MNFETFGRDLKKYFELKQQLEIYKDAKKFIEGKDSDNMFRKIVNKRELEKEIAHVKKGLFAIKDKFEANEIEFMIPSDILLAELEKEFKDVNYNVALARGQIKFENHSDYQGSFHVVSEPYNRIINFRGDKLSNLTDSEMERMIKSNDIIKIDTCTRTYFNNGIKDEATISKKINFPFWKESLEELKEGKYMFDLNPIEKNTMLAKAAKGEYGEKSDKIFNCIISAFETCYNSDNTIIDEERRAETLKRMVTMRKLSYEETKSDIQ